MVIMDVARQVDFLDAVRPVCEQARDFLIHPIINGGYLGPLGLDHLDTSAPDEPLIFSLSPEASASDDQTDSGNDDEEDHIMEDV